MKPSLSAAIVMTSFAVMVSDAKAEQKVLVAECHGKGARFFLSEILQSEANVLLGTSGPLADTAVVIIGPGRAPVWSTASRRQIDIDCGGDGQDEIELFPGIQPRDGTWLTRVTTRMEGCPPIVQQAAGANLPGPQTDTRRMEWPRPFDPNQLSRDFNPGHVWRPAGEDRWTASILDAANFPKFEGEQFARGELVMTLRSETEITMTNTIQIKLPAIAQQALGGGTDCRILTDSVSSWQEG